MSKTKDSKKSLTLSSYGIDDEMADLIKFPTDEHFKNFFINRFKKPIIGFQLDKIREIYLWNKQFRFYEKIKNEKVIEQEMINLVNSEWRPIFDKVEHDYELARMNIDKEEPSTLIYANNLKELLKNIKYILMYAEKNNNSKSINSKIISSTILSDNEIDKLNTLPDYVNFRNCKVNLKTGEVSKRTKDDFITEFINFDYDTNTNSEITKKIKTMLKRICNNNKEELEFLLSFLGYSITSETKEQKFLNLYGPSASNGKSTLIKLMNSVFGIYTTKTDRRTFNDNYTKSHKNFAKMKKKRLVYVEEIEKGKVNTELLKDIVDGDKIENEILFSTTEEINIDFKLFIISNHMLRFNTDPGIARRLICMEFNTRFSEPSEYEKEKEEFKDRHVFEKDLSLIHNFENNIDYKNAFANLIIQYAMKYYETNTLNIPQKFKDATEELCHENDKMKQFLEDKFEITRSDEDRICKEEFHKMYIDYTGLKMIEWGYILSDIKRLNLRYSSGNLRTVYNGKSERNVILGLKKKKQEIINEPEFKDDKPKLDKNGLDFGLDDNEDDDRSTLSKNEVESIKNENLELRMRLDFMQKEMDELKKLLQQQNKKQNTEVSDDLSLNTEDIQPLTDSDDILEHINATAKNKKMPKSTCQDKGKQYKKINTSNSD
jgi:P4 family phage/plasmid primase-like protien